MPCDLKIGTLNLCLGLPNKKDMVVEMLRLNKLNVCWLQETEIPENFPENILNFNGYDLELETNKEKSE